MPRVRRPREATLRTMPRAASSDSSYRSMPFSGVYPANRVLFPSKTIRLGSVLYPFGGLRYKFSPQHIGITQIRYRIDGGGWNTISKGTFTDILSAAKHLALTTTEYGILNYEIEITLGDGSIIFEDADIICNIANYSLARTTAVDEKFRPFADVVTAFDLQYLDTIEYSVSGDATIGQTTIPRLNLISGQHTGGNDEDDLEDSGKDFSLCGLVTNTDIVRNITDGSEAVITSVGQITIVGALSGGTDDNWDTNDNYDIVIGANKNIIVRQFEISFASAGYYTITLHATDTGANEETISVRAYIG